MTYSIDLSHINSPFDWSKLSPDVTLVILKVSEGLTFRDNMLPHYLSEIKAKGLDYGLYWFLHPTSPGAAQANNFCDAAQAAGIDWNDTHLTLIACDVENTADDAWVEKNKSTAVQCVLDSVEAAQKRTGLKPFIYSYKGFWTPTLGDTHLLSEYPLWVASYQNAAPGMFGGWTTSQLWQFSQRGSHINSNDEGDIDWSKTMLTLDQLKALSKS